MVTRIYHPNIDDSGNICLEILKDEHWRGSYNLFTVATHIKLLLAEPNIDDPLVLEIVSGREGRKERGRGRSCGQ